MNTKLHDAVRGQLAGAAAGFVNLDLSAVLPPPRRRAHRRRAR